jgi:hypothetical protein
MRKVDLIITGSSRPQLFPFTWESFKKHVHFRGELRVIFHEDFVFPDQSRKVVEYLNHLKKKGEIHEIITHNPSIGLGRALDDLINNHIKSEFIFYLQDDWEFERPIDLDELVWTMEQTPKLNLIFFNKIKNDASINKQRCPEYTFKFKDFTLWHGWTFLPGIWRMSKVREKWAVREVRPEGFFTNRFGNHNQRGDIKYCEQNIGAYALGKNGEPRYVRHIGNDWRMANWRLENGKPGGCHDASRMDDPYRGAWLPPLADRPVHKENPTQEEIDKMLAEEAGIK